ncbi:MAG: cytochrome C, partial [Acidobacteria bacterium]|nr:cytochrome C [Acidobacteriota bacterium]
TMDCLDCHNRPSHSFEMPEPALDKALAAGKISPALPFVKREGARILKASYTSSAEGARRIPAEIEQFYQKERPDLYPSRREEIQKAGLTLAGIYTRNVFPEMKINWGTYPNNIGHTNFPGCFRCHDDLHASKDGKTVPQDCNGCHHMLAMDEAKPEILSKLAIE